MKITIFLSFLWFSTKQNGGDELWVSVNGGSWLGSSGDLGGRGELKNTAAETTRWWCSAVQ